MLVNLHVKNFAIIDEIDVDFSSGLNILTGETGAGKSILIGSISIALGARVSQEIIGKHGNSAMVEIVFQIEDEETKENRIQEIYGEAGLKLKNRVKDMDVRRGLNYKYFTGQDWGKAQNYDLALNRGSLGIEKCAQLIVDAASEE